MKKTNKQFMLLSALGIILVVDAHAWTSLKLFSDYIPYNSFFMPMFVFVSGYFFKMNQDEQLGKYFQKKFLRLMGPYYLWTVFFISIEFVLQHFGYITYDYLTIQKILVNPWTVGSIVSIASPMWFVPALFATQIVYYVLRKIFSKRWNEWISFLIFIVTGIFCVKLSMEGYSANTYLLLPLKVGFFLPFYQMGRVYKLYGEKWIKNCKKWPVLLILLLINMLREVRLENAYAVAFNDIATMGGFTTGNPLSPFVSSFIGITFWLCIVEILTPALKDSKLLNYISNNTFWIMSSHIFLFNVYNAVLVVINKYVCVLDGFDLEKVHATAWYRYEPISQFRLIYFVIGLFGSIGIKYLIDCMIKKHKTRV